MRHVGNWGFMLSGGISCFAESARHVFRRFRVYALDAFRPVVSIMCLFTSSCDRQLGRISHSWTRVNCTGVQCVWPISDNCAPACQPSVIEGCTAHVKMHELCVKKWYLCASVPGTFCKFIHSMEFESTSSRLRVSKFNFDISSPFGLGRLWAIIELLAVLAECGVYKKLHGKVFQCSDFRGAVRKKTRYVKNIWEPLAVWQDLEKKSCFTIIHDQI